MYNDLQLNISKSYEKKLVASQQMKRAIQSPLIIAGARIPSVESLKVIGVIVDQAFD